MKWMALEQLGIQPGDKRPYTMATDVWSYGVTMWEVFSAGKQQSHVRKKYNSQECNSALFTWE